MNPQLTPLLWLGLIAMLVMTMVWLLQWRTRNAGYVDVAWALMLGSAALGFGWFARGDIATRLTVAVLGGLWGFRLGLHLLHRLLREPEDGLVEVAVPSAGPTRRPKAGRRRVIPGARLTWTTSRSRSNRLPTSPTSRTSRSRYASARLPSAPRGRLSGWQKLLR